jgi:serine/threonine protein kinase
MRDLIPETPSDSAPTGPGALQRSLEPDAGDTGPADLPVIPGYEVLGVLGQGGMGVVYKAWQASRQRLVALKLILAEQWAGPKELVRFHTEAQAIARLEHANIVRIYEVGDHAGYPYFALEFMEGGNLARKMGGRPIPPRDAAQLTETLARAMQHVHERGIIHRDLKPANVLLNSDGVFKVSDFGLAKQFPRAHDATETISVPPLREIMTRAAGLWRGRPTAGDPGAGLTESGAVLGTPSYMAPEQALGMIASIGPAADIHALGAILFQLLTGRPPFTGANLREVLDHVRFRKPVPPSSLEAGVPIDLETICLKCLRKTPPERYPSAQALADDLHRFLAGERIEAGTDTAAEVEIDQWASRDVGLSGSWLTQDEWEAWVDRQLGPADAPPLMEQLARSGQQRNVPDPDATIDRRASVATVAIIAGAISIAAGAVLAGRPGAGLGGAVYAAIFCHFIACEKFKPMKMVLWGIAGGLGAAIGAGWGQEARDVVAGAVIGSNLPTLLLALLDFWWKEAVGWIAALWKRKGKSDRRTGGCNSTDEYF